MGLFERSRRYGLCLAILQTAAACSPAPPDPNAVAAEASNATVPADAKLVVVFGDSLYAGYNLAEEEGFGPQLQQALAKGGIEADVVNAGVSGDTSAAALNRLAFVLDGLPRPPDLVLVGLGGNDMLRALDPATTRKNLDAILTELKARRIPAMLTGMLASPNMGPDYAGAFNSIYPDLARKYDVPLYPFFLDGVIGHRALQLPDGIHPNARGVALVTARVTPLVETALRDQDGRRRSRAKR